MSRPDLHTTREALRQGRTSAADELAAARAAAESPAHRHTFLKTRFEAAQGEAAAASPQAPLAGLAVSARLRAAGGVVVGRTNMSEFAFSGVGLNPHYGTPANPCDPAVPRIPGGSSSGAAVSVATGAAFIGLGSDTGGSLRIPAALCGIVGFKSTARLVPTEGALPLSTTLDTVNAMTRSVRDAILAHEILAQVRVPRDDKPLGAYRLAVATTQMLDGLDATVARAFERSVARLRAAGAQVDELALPQIQDLGSIQSTGGFSAAESFAWHRQLLAAHGERYDPRVRHRIERGAKMLAWEYLDLHVARKAWIADIERALGGYDAVLSPTVPMVAPPMADVAPGPERDEAFFRVNALLLRNTSVVNMLDGCALSLPCQADGELPVGLMVWHGGLRDATILNLALQIERLLSPSSPT
jgi:Asp-tRNA(Asn)/Glu-tRNA(Gln) amidotransferase A subunit family amidase